MRWFAASDYWFARLAFQRGLAVIYLIAFAAAARQFRPTWRELRETGPGGSGRRSASTSRPSPVAREIG